MAASDGASSISVAIRVRPFTVSLSLTFKAKDSEDLMSIGSGGGAIDTRI